MDELQMSDLVAVVLITIRGAGGKCIKGLCTARSPMVHMHSETSASLRNQPGEPSYRN
jgi:hypothetical protein